MALAKGKKQLVITIDEIVYKDLERISKTLKLSKSRLARNLLYAGLDDAKILDKLGLLKAIGLYNGFSQRVTEQGFWSSETGILLNGKIK